MKTTIINIYTSQESYVYIGRPGPFGNPHPVFNPTKHWTFCKLCNKAHTRKEAIEAYKTDFYKRIKTDTNFLEQIKQLKGKTLGCYCKPQACHGDVIIEFLSQLT